MFTINEEERAGEREGGKTSWERCHNSLDFKKLKLQVLFRKSESLLM